MAIATKTEGQSAKVAKAAADLQAREQHIAELDAEVFENWVAIGDELAAIRGKFKGPERAAYIEASGCKSWEAYCRTDRHPYKLDYANKLIRGAVYRKALPKPDTRVSGSWTERNVRPLTQLSSPTAAGLVAKQAIKHCEEKDEPLTAAVVTKFVNRAKTNPKEIEAKQKQTGRTPAANLKVLASYANKHLILLQTQPRKFWKDAEEELPGVILRAAKALASLASFIKESAP